MKKFLVLSLILCLALFSVWAQDEKPVEPVVPVTKQVTRLDVTIIDDINGNSIKLDNSIVQVMGELHVCEDSFNYSNTFTDGHTYDMVIWVRLKK